MSPGKRKLHPMNIRISFLSDQMSSSENSFQPPPFPPPLLPKDSIPQAVIITDLSLSPAPFLGVYLICIFEFCEQNPVFFFFFWPFLVPVMRERLIKCPKWNGQIPTQGNEGNQGKQPCIARAWMNPEPWLELGPDRAQGNPPTPEGVL